MITSNITMRCYRCHGLDVVQDRARGDIICRICGEVLSQRCIDTRPAWDDEIEASNATGGNTYDTYEGNHHDSNKNISKNFTIVSSSNISLIEQIERTARLLDTKQDQKIKQVVLHVRDISTILFLNKIVEDRAETIATRAIKESSRRYSNLPLAVTAIYLACRMHNCSRSLKEMHASTGIGIKVINKLSKAIADELNLDIGRVLAEHIVPRIASNVRLGSPQGDISRAICQNIREGGLLEGVDPSYLAAAVILFVMVLLKKLPNASFELQSHLIKFTIKKEINIDMDCIADSAFCTTSNMGGVYDKLIKVIPHLILLKRMSSSDNDICIPTFEEIKKHDNITPINENIIIAINSFKKAEEILETPVKIEQDSKKRRFS